METFLERWYLARRTVRTDNDLFLLIVQSVESVEELFLSPLFSSHELNVVDQQHVHRSILLTETLRLVVANRIDQIVHESLGRDVTEFQVLVSGFDRVAARVHQVRLA